MKTPRAEVLDRVSAMPEWLTPVRVLQTAGVLSLLTLLYGRTTVSLVRDWMDESSLSYGMLVVPMAAYMAWLDRRLTLREPVAPTGRGLWLIAGACMVFIFGRLSATDFFSRVSIVICIAGIVWTFWGTARLVTLAKPLVLLATMVPPPVLIMDRLSLPLRLLASSWATTTAQALGVSVNQDGNVIHLATVSLGVADACSGINSLLAMFVTAVVLSLTMCDALWTRGLLALLSVPIAVFFNIVRIAGTALIADYQPELAMGFYHMFSGWLIFVLGAGSVFVAAKLLARVGHNVGHNVGQKAH